MNACMLPQPHSPTLTQFRTTTSLMLLGCCVEHRQPPLSKTCASEERLPALSSLALLLPVEPPASQELLKAACQRTLELVC